MTHRPLFVWLAPLRRPFFYIKVVLAAFRDFKNPVAALAAQFSLGRAKGTYTFRNGLSIRTIFSDDIKNIFTIFFYKCYDDIDDHLTIIDVGGNIGVFALYAAYDKNSRVFVYEPSPVNYDALDENIARNDCAGSIVVRHQAVAGERGPVMMEAGEGDASRLYLEGESPDSGAVEVAGVTLADVFAEHNLTKVDILKMDCEGSEYGVLYGASDDLLAKIAEIRIECHAVDDDQRNTRGMRAFLESKGYTIWRVYEKDVLLARRDD